MIKLLPLFLLISFIQPSLAKTFTQIEQDLTQIETQDQQLAYMLQQQPEVALMSGHEQAKYWLQLGLTQDQNGLIDNAILSFSQSIALFENQSLSITPEWPISYIERSYMYYLQTNDPTIYCPDRQQALELARKLDHGETLVRSLIAYAFCLGYNHTQLSEGIALLEEAIDIAERQQLPKGQYAMIYNASGNLYKANFIFDKAYAFILKAFQQWQSVEDIRDMFNMQHILMSLAIELNDYALAKQHVETMFSLSGKHPEHIDFTFFAHFNAGALAYKQGKFAEANIELEKALNLKETTQEQYFIHITEYMLALSYFRNGQFELAQGLSNQLTAPAQTNQDQYHSVKGLLAYFEDDYLSAMTYLLNGIDHALLSRRQYVQKANLITTQIYNQSVAELDNKILQQELEIQQFQLSEQSYQSKITFMTLGLIVSVLLVLLLVISHLVKTRRNYRLSAQTDFLTNVANRRHIYSMANDMAQKAVTTSSPLSILLFDIDHFKQVNDQLGHASGDRALKLVCQKALSCMRQEDKIGRVGGEEFLVLLPETSTQTAMNIAERLRQNIADQHIRKDEKQLPLSISIGVSRYRSGENIEETVAKADSALYQAKRTGRNKVCVDKQA